MSTDGSIFYNFLQLLTFFFTTNKHSLRDRFILYFKLKRKFFEKQPDNS
ncbi:hypothetical protein D1BOALGB6SA_9111 [Olavius sp. associated proteobacterium Delta 1]|nr:hypothetical protein D1BOALGB6SA_9111 [Olavius sp. associated proteobacterium Delta 1]